MSNCIFVMAQDGTLLMPTFNWKKVRRQLKTGRAKIAGHEPFTIQLCYKSTKNTQPIETCEDTGTYIWDLVLNPRSMSMSPMNVIILAGRRYVMMIAVNTGAADVIESVIASPSLTTEAKIHPEMINGWLHQSRIRN